LIYPKLASYNLEELISFLNIEGTNSHNALDDAKATVSLIKKLNIDYLKNLKDAQFEYLSNQDNILILNNFIKIFKNIYSRIQTQLELHITLSQAINQYLEYYKNEFCPKKEDWDYEMDEIDKLLKHIYSYTNKNDKETLRQKINKYIPEYKMFKEADLYLGIEKVLISTVYKAKGLEFDNVIVAEATDDCYPHLYPIKKQIADRQRCKVYKINWGDVTSQEKRLLEEQTLESARAFYVAMTRSKKKLYITWHKQGPFLYEDRNTGQSIFLTREKSRYIKCISEFFLKVKT
jgi:DNA helicase-2/ATP-dependent DNA helicase PcrA